MWKVSDDLLITEQFSTGSGATETKSSIKQLNNYLIRTSNTSAAG